MMKNWIILGAVVVFAACGSETNQETTADGAAASNVEYVYNGEDADKMVASISISGMSCEQMCVGSIKSKLAGMEGVESTDFKDFDGEQELNLATVAFDPDKVKPEDMVAAIHGLYDGAYGVKKVKVEAATPAVDNTPPATNNGESSTSMGFRIPSLVEYLGKLF